MVFSAVCRGISALAPAASPPPSSSLTLVSAELLLSHILAALSLWLQNAVKEVFSSFLKYVIPEALPPSLVGSALASCRSVLEPADFGSIGHRGSFQQLLKEATPVALLLPKPGCTNPVHWVRL